MTWVDPVEADFARPLFLSARLSGPSSAELNLRPFSDDVVLDFGEHDNGGGYAVSIELHDGRWRNSAILYRGASAPFAMVAGETSSVPIQLARMLTGSPVAASRALDEATVSHHTRLALDGSLEESLVGEFASTTPSGSRLLVFSTEDINAGPPVAELELDGDATFAIEIQRPGVSLNAPLFVAVVEADLLVTDASDAPGPQAMRVLDFAVESVPVAGWTQSRTDASLAAPPTATRALSFEELENVERAAPPAVATLGKPYWKRTWPRAALPSPEPYAVSATDFASATTLTAFLSPEGDASLEVWAYDQTGWHPQPAPEISLGTKTIALAYDGFHREFVLVALASPEERLGLWAFKDGSWTREALPDALPELNAFRLAYHDELGRLLLVGTRPEAVDTWIRDVGNAWTVDQEQGPSELADLQLAYDPDRGVVVMFALGVADDAQTWEFAAAGWNRRSVLIQPPPRGDFSLTYDRVARATVLMGGRSNSEALSGVYYWNGSTWAEALPRPQYVATGFSAHTAFPDPGERGIIVFGGMSDSDPPDKLGIQRWFRFAWRPEPIASSLAPPSGAGATMVFDVSRGHAVLDGAEDENDSTWLRRGRVWTERQNAAFDATGGAAAYDSDREASFLFARTASTSSTATFRWSDVGWQPVAAPGGPQAKTGARAVYSRGEDAILHFGGVGSTATNELWRFADGTWSELPMGETTPRARSGHGLAYGGTGRGVRLVGGFAEDGSPIGEESIFSIAWQDPVSLPFEPRANFAFVFDSLQSMNVLFGGAGRAPIIYGETWERKGGWRRVEVSGPSPRHSAASAYDPICACTVVVGGDAGDGDLPRDVWEYHHPRALLPGVVVEIPVVTEGVQAVAVHAEIGGDGEGTEGASVEVFDFRHQRWQAIATTNAPSAAPRDVDTLLPQPIFDFIQDDRIAVRTRPLAGGVAGEPPGTVALLSARATTKGQQPTSQPTCGDGVISAVERCDDGNDTAGDGCSPSCWIERYFSCTGAPSTCFACGDGSVDASEACDDGEVAAGADAPRNGDGCNDRCRAEPQ